MGVCLTILSALLAAGCGSSAASGAAAAGGSSSENDTAIAGITKGISEDRIHFKDTDAYTDWSDEDVTTIDLNDDETSVDGDGASYSNGAVTISGAGTYVFSGTLSDGTILIEADEKDDVRLVLNGVSVKNADGSCIAVQEADKVILSLEEGMENTLEDAEEYTDDEEFDSVIDAHADLVINGEGSLQINALYNDGIKSHDDLRILGGNISVVSEDDALVAKDSLQIKKGTFEIDSGGDGLKAANDEDAMLGFVYIENGSFTVNAGDEAIQAETDIQINDGQFDLTSGGGAENAPQRQDEFVMGPGGGSEGFGGRPGPGGQAHRPGENENNTDEDSRIDDAQAADEEDDTDTDSTEAVGKGMRTNGTITLNGGTYSIDSADDGIHSNSAVVINGGEFTISAGDDGIHSDDTLMVNGGVITVRESYEGLESAEITVSDGTIDITASDDGINAAGGEAESGSSSAQRVPMMETSSGYLTIDGGTITVNADGDGLDANTSITQSGGDVVVYGPTDSANGSLDYAETYEMSGGTLLAVGSSGMLQSISDSSDLNALTVVGSGKEGDTITILDPNGETLISVTAPKSCQAVTYAAPSLTEGETYTVIMGEVQTGVKLSGTNTIVNSDGSVWSGDRMNRQ